jgi:hypothetical protein
MDKKNIQSILKDAVEHEVPSSQIDLLPHVKERLVAGTVQQGEKMNSTNPRRIARVALATLTVFALLVVAFVTPQGRAFAQSVLQFFVRSEMDTIPVPTSDPIGWVDLTSTAPSPTRTPFADFASECGDNGSPTCSIEQIRNMVDFTVKEPGYIPDGLYFEGATGGPDSIYFNYSSPDHSATLTIFVERWTGSLSPLTDLVGSSAVVEKVQVGHLSGEYYKGSFVYKDGQDVATWDPNFESETLRWVDGDASYKIVYGSQIPMRKEGMVVLAETMTLAPVSKPPMPTMELASEANWDPREYWSLSVTQLEQQMGETLMLPTTLPEILLFLGAHYESETKVASVYYQLDQTLWGPNSNGLALSQQVIDSPECSLCDILVGDLNEMQKDNPNRMIVSPDANKDVVQIGTSEGTYVEGTWQGTDCCGWVWQSDPYLKFLRWRVGNRAFELSYMGNEIEKEDMIRIAESLK